LDLDGGNSLHRLGCPNGSNNNRFNEIEDEMILKFEGIVSTGDDYRCSDDDDKNGSVFIGNEDVVEKIENANFQKPVTVAIADERFSGDLAVETGWGYSEYTPMDPDILIVGDHDLIDILARYTGQKITMWIADEPVNVLDNSPNKKEK
jgi:hypothetical protein